MENPKYLKLKVPLVTGNLKSMDDTVLEILNTRGDLKKDSNSNLSMMDMKCELANRTMIACELCPRKCMANRFERIGECGVGHTKIKQAYVLTNEEFGISPAFSVWFNGCTMSCAFCYNPMEETYDNTPEDEDKYIERLITELTTPVQATCDEGEFTREWKMKPLYEGLECIDWLGGEPTPNIPFILKFLNHPKMNLPIKQVLNTNMYMSKRAMNLLSGVIDTFLADLKFGNDYCAKRLGGVRYYTSTVRENIMKALRSGSNVYLRHLVLPNHFECCTKPIIEWIKNDLPKTDKVKIHIMNQYQPEHKAKEYPEISSYLENDEYQRAMDYYRNYTPYPHRESSGRDRIQYTHETIKCPKCKKSIPSPDLIHNTCCECNTILYEAQFNFSHDGHLDYELTLDNELRL